MFRCACNFRTTLRAGPERDVEISDVSGVVVIGALVGLLFVALGYGQMVWLSRQRRELGPESAGPRSPVLGMLLVICLALSAISLAYAVGTRTLSEREALLSGEDLFSVKPRAGLAASYVASGPNVRKGEVLIQFGGQDAEEALLAVKSRRRLLEGELELERVRPLELDPELVRRADAARLHLREVEARSRQLATERDGILREAEQQRLNIGNRRFRVEQEDRAAVRDEQQLRETLQTQRKSLESHESLLAQGLLSRYEVQQERDAVRGLETRLAEISDRRAILEREGREVAGLRTRTESNVTGQLGSRQSELKAVEPELISVRAAAVAAEAALERDRPRAQSQNEKRLRQFQVQIDECDALINGRGKQAAVEAPWDGRIAFREPSPSSMPADNGPLLVLAQPDKLAVTLRLEADEPGAFDDDLDAEFRAVTAASSNDERLGRSVPTFAGRVAQRRVQPMGFVELRVPCDPQELLVRQVAVGGSVPVRARLRRRLSAMLSFRLSLLFAVLAAGFALVRSSRRRRPEVRGVPAVVQASTLAPWSGAASVVDLVEDRDTGTFQPAAESGSPPAQFLLTAEAGPSGSPSDEVLAAQVLLVTAAADDLGSSRRQETSWLTGLGLRLRQEVETCELAPAFVREVDTVLRAGGYPAVALVVAGFGSRIEKHAVARAAFFLLERSFDEHQPAVALSEGAHQCARFLHVMRAIGSERLNGAIDQLRSGLIESALDAAQRHGTSVEKAGILLRPLTEA